MSPFVSPRARNGLDRPPTRDPRHVAMIMEELIATGIDPERFVAAARVLRGSSWGQLQAALSTAFTSEQLGELRALYEWQGSWAESDVGAVAYLPRLDEVTRAELARRVRNDGLESLACVVLLYMSARARALVRYRALRHEA